MTVLHGVPGLDVDVYADGEPLIEGFAPGESLGPIELPADDYEITVFPAGEGPEGDPAISADVTVPEGVDATAIAHLDADATPTLSVFVNDTSEVPADTYDAAGGEVRQACRAAFRARLTGDVGRGGERLGGLRRRRLVRRRGGARRGEHSHGEQRQQGPGHRGPPSRRAAGDLEVIDDVEHVGWYRHGPAPGAVGSAVLAAHVDTARDGRGAFFHLGRLGPDERIEVELEDGTVTEFVVEGLERHPKADLPLDELFSRQGPARLALITCGGEFGTSRRHYADNVVVTAVARE